MRRRAFSIGRWIATLYTALFALIVSPLGYLLIGPIGEASAKAAEALF